VIERLHGRTVVVTGAASGIGASIARGAAAEGGTVACLDLDEDGAAGVAEGLPSALALGCDLTSLAAVEASFATVVDRLGRVDAVVHSAGGSRGEATPFLELDEAAWHRMVDRNLTSSFHCGLVAGRQLAQTGGGSIVLISSQLSQVVRPGLAHYSAAKGGVNQLVKGMALDLAPHRIRVNAVAPGPMSTPGNQAWFSRPEVQAEHARVIPLGRVGEPEETVGAVLYLMSDEASYTTGATLFVDGGYTIV
jgi:NAD(P)-dependent dehydrogenase (short-subunit alcohol dehydrogenase family)